MSTPLEVIKEGDRFGSLMNMTPDPDSADFVFFVEDMKDYSLALLQALHDELEGKKRKVWSELEFSKLGFMEMHQAGTDVSYNQAIKDQQDNLQALMKKIQA